MEYNDVLRSLRFTFDFSDDQMMQIFNLSGYPASRAEVSDWLKKSKDPDFSEISDELLATFLNGFIIFKRGRKKGKALVPEKELNNNIIFWKLRIALNLKTKDIIKILSLADVEASKHEINAFFRKKGQRQYRKCLDQYLRNFLYGLKLRERGEELSQK